MKVETIINLVGSILFGSLGLIALVSIIFFAAWWHIITAVGSLSMAYTLYTDSEYGTESVQAYFKRIKSK